jgi:hypothetical protein
MRMISLLILLAAAASAALTGTIVGTIRTEAGRAAVGVSVRLLGTDRVAHTGDDGRFRLDDVPPGDRRIEIHAENHAAIQLPVPVHAGDNTIGTLTLQPEMPTIRGDAGLPTWKRATHPSALVFTLGSTCDSLATRCDSIRAWGRCSAAVDSAITFECDAPRRLDRLAIRIVNDKDAIVRHLREGAASGPSTRIWDARDDSGRMVSAASYRGRFVAPRDSVEIPFCVRHAAPPG